MISAVLINHEPETLQFLEKNLNIYYPQLKICGCATSAAEASKLIDLLNPSLTIIEIEMPNLNGFQILKNCSFYNFELICISRYLENAIDAFKNQACGFLLKPIQVEELIIAVNNAKARIDAKMQSQSQANHKLFPSFSPYNPPGALIGIPTIEGFDFIPVEEIIRCEGLQNCTRIVTQKKSDIVSSYNIGEFRKQLEKFGFFTSHKSHLINLIHIKKYYKEGTIYMSDKSYVPVAKRRKSQFLKLMLLSR